MRNGKIMRNCKKREMVKIREIVLREIVRLHENA